MANRSVPSCVKDSIRASNQDCVYGLDAELAAKAKLKHDPALQAEAQGFIESLTGERFGGDFMEALKNGVLLCKAMNKVKPGTIRRINDSKMPFKQMENISNFLKGCRALGMSEYDLFTTPDLYDGKSVNNVVSGIVAFGRLSQKLGFAGPTIGAKESTSNRRQFTDQQMRGDGGATKMGMGSSGVMQRTALDTSRNIAFGAQSSGISGGGATKMGMGSSSTMDRSAMDTSRNITFGAQSSGASGGGATKMGMGSSSTMQRGAVDTSRNITFGAKSSGAATSGTSTKMMAGSSGTMDRSEVNVSNNITFGANAGATKSTYSGKKWGIPASHR